MAPTGVGDSTGITFSRALVTLREMGPLASRRSVVRI
jgi:hypothetical protein